MELIGNGTGTLPVLFPSVRSFMKNLTVCPGREYIYANERRFHIVLETFFNSVDSKCILRWNRKVSSIIVKYLTEIINWSFCPSVDRIKNIWQKL